MAPKEKLIIIPGIGDDLAIYQTFAKRWRRFGYDVHVISFGWANHSARLKDKMESFLAKVDALGDGDIYLIGVSAGGTTAVNAFAQRPNIRKVITVCAPLDTMIHLRNPLLAESIEQTRQLLQHFNPLQQGQILSVLALHDSVVDTKLSQPDGIRTLRVAMVVHPVAIFVALLFYAPKLQRFLVS